MHLYLLTHLVSVFIPHSRHLTGNLSRGRSPDVLAPPCVFQVPLVYQSWYAPQFAAVSFGASFSKLRVPNSPGSPIVTSPPNTNSDYLRWGLCFLGLGKHNLDGSISTGVFKPRAVFKTFGWRGTGPVAALKCKQLLVLASSESPLRVSKTTKFFERTEGEGNAWRVHEAHFFPSDCWYNSFHKHLQWEPPTGFVLFWRPGRAQTAQTKTCPTKTWGDLFEVWMTETCRMKATWSFPSLI